MVMLGPPSMLETHVHDCARHSFLLAQTNAFLRAGRCAERPGSTTSRVTHIEAWMKIGGRTGRRPIHANSDEEGGPLSDIRDINIAWMSET